MKIRSIALLAIAVSGGLCAANSPGGSLAVYYSFDVPPPAALITEMQAELDRILTPADLRARWRDLESTRNGAEGFSGIVVFRFRGSCSLTSNPAANEIAGNPVGQALAQTDIVDGHVLPFGQVNCDKLRLFIAPALKFSDTEERNAALGRAIARVSAHEIYHVLTGSPTHAARGIARASHTRAELTAPTFAFAPAEVKWLRAWASNLAPLPVVTAQRSRSSVAESESGATDPVALDGR